MPIANMFNDQIPTGPTRQEDKDILKCPKCKCTWFKEEKYAQRADSHTVILAQSVPPKSPEFILLICGRCGEKVEPRLLRQTRDTLDREYDKFYDEMNKDVATEKL